jgi:hypothetical protein
LCRLSLTKAGVRRPPQCGLLMAHLKACGQVVIVAAAPQVMRESDTVTPSAQSRRPRVSPGLHAAGNLARWLAHAAWWVRPLPVGPQPGQLGQIGKRS